MYCNYTSSLKTVSSAYLVKISPQEMHLLVFLQQPGPIFLLHFLLPELKDDIPTCVMCLALLRIDFLVED